MKVLIGVDDSEHSRAALEFVKSLKWESGTRFVVLAAANMQVVTHSLVDAGGFTWIKAEEEALNRHAEELTSSAERELERAGLDAETQVVHGDARQALVDAARALSADMIVVGSHGRTGLDKLMMGSVASHVVTHAPCTVLVVKLKKTSANGAKGVREKR